MKSVILLLAALALDLILSSCEKESPTQPVTPTANPTAWVVNSSARTLSRIDLATDSVTVNVLSIGQLANDIVISGSTAYVVNSGDNNIQIINLATAQTIGTIEITLGSNPYSIILDGSGHAYVPNLMTGNVSVLDLNTHQEVDTLNVGVAPEGACIYQNELYITDINSVNWVLGQGYVYAYSLPALNRLAAIPVAMNPQAIVPGPDGLLHVVCTGDYTTIAGQIQVINPATHTVVDSIATGGTPGSLAFRSQKAYVGAGGWGSEGYVYSYNGLTHQLLNSSANPITVPSGAYETCVTSTGRVLVCCQGADQVAELDSTGTLVHTFAVGDGPVAIAVWEP